MKKINALKPFFSLALILLFSCQNSEPAEKVISPEIPKIVYDEYGIEDTLKSDIGFVKKNQTFSDILYEFGVPYQRILDAAKTSKPILDVRKIRKGDKYKIYFDTDSLESVKYFVYASDRVDYFIFKFDSTITVQPKSKSVRSVKKTAAGIIESSLYLTMSDQKLPAQLAMELSEILAWQVDFYRIRTGDSFKVIYNEDYVDSISIGIGNIIAVEFTNMNEKYYGFLFEQDGREEYFDEYGKSLRKAFLKAPVKFSRISSHYSTRRYHPILHRMKSHLGTDYAAPRGTPIQATGDGVVIEARYKRNNGNYVKIKHNATYTTQYLHMTNFAKGIRSGVKVKQGQTIGYVGSTGLATGPHVCYRFWKNGKQVNHLREKVPSTHPVSDSNMTKFNLLKGELMNQLNGIYFPVKKDQKQYGNEYE